MNLYGRDFLKLLDYTPEEIDGLLTLAADLKAKKKAGVPHRLCEGKNIALIFEKTSTRTRCSFEVAAHDLGMGTTYLDPAGSQIGKKESIADTARVLSGIYDGIEYRGYGQKIVEELAKYASVPVWNGLTNEFHPTQVLADLLTVRERFGRLKGVRLVYMGDARFNMGNSLMVGCAKMGMQFTACAPQAYFPAPELAADLGPGTGVLVIASAANLDLCQGENLYRLPVPASRADLYASLDTLLHQRRRRPPPARQEEAQRLIRRAKELLMDVNRMSEAEAHRFLQKRSMDTGLRLEQTARLVIETYTR